jgi:hypothetical protein
VGVFYFPGWHRFDEKPVIFVFSPRQLELDAQKFNSTAATLLERAQNAARSRGLSGIFFVETTNLRPDNSLEENISAQGFSAYSGWNYFTAQDTKPVADYSAMVNTYLAFYSAAATTSGKLPYIVPVSPDWDTRPWDGSKAVVRTEPTPEKFQTMLDGARRLLERGKAQSCRWSWPKHGTSLAKARTSNPQRSGNSNT